MSVLDEMVRSGLNVPATVAAFIAWLADDAPALSPMVRSEARAVWAGQARENWQTRAHEDARDGGFGDAAWAFGLATRLDPTLTYAWERALCHLAIGRPNEAARALEAFLRDGSDHHPLRGAAQRTLKLLRRMDTGRGEFPGPVDEIPFLEGDPVQDELLALTESERPRLRMQATWGLMLVLGNAKIVALPWEPRAWARAVRRIVQSLRLPLRHPPCLARSVNGLGSDPLRPYVAAIHTALGLGEDPMALDKWWQDLFEVRDLDRTTPWDTPSEDGVEETAAAGQTTRKAGRSLVPAELRRPDAFRGSP